MRKQDVLVALLNSLIDPIVFVDTEHVIQYMNKEAIEKYGNLVGDSIFSCHNERSKGIIIESFERLQNGTKKVICL